MIIKELLAKKFHQNEENLYEHSLNISNLSYELANDICDDEIICWLCYISGLLHDIGKTSIEFQNHLKNGEKITEHFYPLHNILGACLVSNFIKCENPFLDIYINKVIAKTILYHHPLPFGIMEKQIESIEKIINEIYFKNIIKEFILINNNKFPKFQLRLVEKDEIYVQSTLSNLDYYETNCDFSITKQDIFNIVSNIIRFADSIISLNKKPELLVNRKNLINPFNIKKPLDYDYRFNIQNEYAKELAKNYESIFESQTGFGKTMLGLLYSLYSNNRRTYWICPRNTIAEGVYQTLNKEINKLGLEKNLSISLLLTNEFIYGDDKSDIIVTNIDNFLRPVISSDSIERTYHLLHSNCIFDEFHEYVMQAPIMALFEIMIRSRHKVKTNTLFLSATPILNFFNFIKEEKIKHIIHMDENIAQRKFNISFKDNIEEIDNISKGSLISTNSTKLAQDLVINNKANKTFHSRFLKSDRERIFNEIENEFGKDSIIKTNVISATNIITTGIDISFNNVIITSPLPDRMIQTIGRCNRWGESKDNCIIIIPTPKAHISEKYSLNEQKYTELTNSFYLFLKENLSNKTEITFNELYLLRKKYYEIFKDKYNLNYFLKHKEESFKNLKDVNYQMSIERETIDENLIYIGNNVLRKNDSINFYCLLTDGKGNDIDEVFEGNSVIFNFTNNVFKSKNGRKLTEIFEKANIKKFKHNEKYFGNKKQQIENRIKKLTQQNKMFDFLFDKAKCKDTPLYIPCIWYYDKNLGVMKENV